MTYGFEHLSGASLINLLPIYWVSFLLTENLRILYIVWIQVLFQVNNLQTFSFCL